MQAKMQEEFGERYELPSIYLTQLLGLAMGLEPEAVGLQENQIRCDEIVRLWRNSAAF
jgi:heterodisulfide reductase subunit B